jgi:hypothetical protein
MSAVLVQVRGGPSSGAALRPAHSLVVALRDALLIVLLCAVLGTVVNALRASGIPLVQKTEYEILVPCPEGSGNVESLSIGDPKLADKRSLWVDARNPAEHQRWHPAPARNVPFDYLEPTCAAEVRGIAASGASQVVVFGDGKDPDSGEQLARELAGRGIRNVRFVQGGAAALAAAAAGGAR